MFLGEAIDSVLSQSYADLELVIVDDGSTDDSVAVINEYAERDSKIIPVFKKNGGQLSAFNAGVEKSSGHLLFFLDADDRFRKDYLEKAVDVFTQHTDCDFLCTALREFDLSSKLVAFDYPDRVTDLGYTGVLTSLTHNYIGLPTSGLSLTRALAKRIFPIQNENDWRSRADDCITWTSSLARGRKFYLNEPLIEYRVHGKNQFAGKKFDSITEKYKRGMLIHSFFAQAAYKFPEYDCMDNKYLLRLLLLEAASGKKNDRLIVWYGKAISRCKKINIINRIYYGYGMRILKSRFVKYISTKKLTVR